MTTAGPLPTADILARLELERVMRKMPQSATPRPASPPLSYEQRRLIAATALAKPVTFQSPTPTSVSPPSPLPVRARQPSPPNAPSPTPAPSSPAPVQTPAAALVVPPAPAPAPAPAHAPAPHKQHRIPRPLDMMVDLSEEDRKEGSDLMREFVFTKCTERFTNPPIEGFHGLYFPDGPCSGKFPMAFFHLPQNTRIWWDTKELSEPVRMEINKRAASMAFAREPKMDEDLGPWCKKQKKDAVPAPAPDPAPTSTTRTRGPDPPASSISDLPDAVHLLEPQTDMQLTLPRTLPQYAQDGTKYAQLVSWISENAAVLNKIKAAVHGVCDVMAKDKKVDSNASERELEYQTRYLRSAMVMLTINYLIEKDGFKNVIILRSDDDVILEIDMLKIPFLWIIAFVCFQKETAFKSFFPGKDFEDANNMIDFARTDVATGFGRIRDEDYVPKDAKKEMTGLRLRDKVAKQYQQYFNVKFD